jgi:hypothetical protein
MSDDKDIITIDQTPTEYGDRQAVATFGRRIKAMLPGGDKMTDAQAMALAQYSMLLDANPFRGEVYGYTDSHGFHLVDGYKMLVRWARKTCPYTETYKPIEDLPQGAIGFRCYILREDSKAMLREFVSLGATFDQAYELATVSAVGVVTKSDMTTRSGNPMPPPSGWTWEQVARKRALKNALNLSHGAPSPREIAAGSWEVNGVQTTPEDWDGVTPEMPPYEREAIAEGSARIRQAHENAQERIEQGHDANEASTELFDEPIQHVTAPDFSGGAMDADGYEDLKEERIGKDPAELIAQGKAQMEQDAVPTILAPPEENDWTSFYSRCIEELGYKHPDHASRVKDEIWLKDPAPTWAELWEHMINHQHEKGRL